MLGEVRPLWRAEIVDGYDIYVLKLLCFESVTFCDNFTLCYETLTIWNTYVIKLLC
jgi:hypothetical protein